jgi:hypothetical protein
MYSSEFCSLRLTLQTYLHAGITPGSKRTTCRRIKKIDRLSLDGNELGVLLLLEFGD